VIASKGGAPTHPDWYRNLLINPEVTVETTDGTYKAYAVEVTGAERDRLWADAVATEPGFGEYEAKAQGRKIPVIVFERD
jgi:deazaflavin-dependent oxidoreductase (nitroreductase family)